MTLERIHLVDRDPALVAAWREVFRDHPEVVPSKDDYFSVSADAMVSPANSFGIMDGGLDAAIAAAIPGVERRVRERIAKEHHGELPVGLAEVVPTDDARWPYLIVAPTMRIPEDVSRTTHAYVAFRAILLAVRRHAGSGAPIRTLLCCGLCTGIGAMPARRAAVQMRMAYRQVAGDGRPPPFADIHEHHRIMRTIT